MTTPKIQLAGVTKSFDGKQVLRGIDVAVEAQESLCIIGTSGCGKSVSLKCLLGLIVADGGSIKIDGQEIHNILTINGVRFSFEDGSWGLIRASSNKPSLVIVTESPSSNERKKKIFDFIDNLLKKTGKIGEYDQKI